MSLLEGKKTETLSIKEMSGVAGGRKDGGHGGLLVGEDKTQYPPIKELSFDELTRISGGRKDGGHGGFLVASDSSAAIR